MGRPQVGGYFGKLFPMGYRDTSFLMLRKWEGQVAYMYRDSSKAGYCTCATGKMLVNALAAAALPFRLPSGAPATPAQISAEYARVMAMPAGLEYHHYFVPAALTLAQAFMDHQLVQLQDQCEVELRATFPGYDALPDQVKVVLIDMDYNLGHAGLLKYTHMVASIRARQFIPAAGQCHRDGVQPARNTWAHDQLVAAWALGGAG